MPEKTTRSGVGEAWLAQRESLWNPRGNVGLPRWMFFRVAHVAGALIEAVFPLAITGVAREHISPKWGV